MVEEFSANSVIDVGCGTGSLLCLLSERDIDLIGIDPAEASLEIARKKPGADHVRWCLGDATTLPDLSADLAVMTGREIVAFDPRIQRNCRICSRRRLQVVTQAKDYQGFSA